MHLVINLIILKATLGYIVCFHLNLLSFSVNFTFLNHRLSLILFEFRFSIIIPIGIFSHFQTLLTVQILIFLDSMDSHMSYLS